MKIIINKNLALSLNINSVININSNFITPSVMSNVGHTIKNNKLLGIYYYSTENKNNIAFSKKLLVIKLNPQWVSGFADAESCFMIQIYKNTGKLGWAISPSFVVHLHSKDINLLYALQNYFGVGKVFEAKDGKSASFVVKKLKDILDVIIPHFKQYPLQSGKSVDFEIWALCINILFKKEHLTIDGLKKIVSLKYALNKGLPESLGLAFKDVKPFKRFDFKKNNSPLDPNWVSGFSEGDSSFFVTISEKTNRVRIIYSINLNERDLPVIWKLQEFFNDIGKISNYKNIVQYVIADFEKIDKILIPHFDTYELKGNKLYNYLIWKEIFNLVKIKTHLSSEGLEKIYNLRQKLNVW